MKSKKFYLWLMIAAFIFAVFSLGGCGGGHSGSTGSSSNNGGNGETSQNALSLMSKAVESSDMAAVMNTDEFKTLINDVYLKQGNYTDIPENHFYFKFNDETKAKILSGLTNDEKETAQGFFFTPEDAKERYDNGEVLILVAPDTTFVNEALETVGLNPAYGNGEQLEAFALAKREIVRDVSDDVKGDVKLSKVKTFHFFYEVPHVNEFELSEDVSVDTSISVDSETDEATQTDDSEDNDTFEEIEENQTVEKFNVTRWKNMFNWCLSIDKEAGITDAEASSIEFNAAEVNDITKVSTAQIKTIDLSYKKSNYSIRFAEFSRSVNVDRETSVTFKIYNCHSYNNHNDYYFVTSNLQTTPKAFTNTRLELQPSKGTSVYVNFVYGYTKDFKVSFDAEGAEVDNNHSYPKTVEPRSTLPYDIVWYNDSGDLGAGTDHFSNLSYMAHKTITTTLDWRLIKLDANTSWRVVIDEPISGFFGRKFGDYVGIKYIAHNQMSLENQFIWKVDKSSWQKNTTLPLNLLFDWADCYCLGKYYTYDSSGGRIVHPFQLKTIRGKKTAVVNVEMPQHSWTHMDIYTFNRFGDRAGVMYMTEGDTWKVSAKDLQGNDIDWIKFEEVSQDVEQPGPVLNMDNWLHFTPTENTTGQSRRAQIHFTANYKDGISETMYIDVIQTSKSKLDPFAN